MKKDNEIPVQFSRRLHTNTPINYPTECQTITYLVFKYFTLCINSYQIVKSLPKSILIILGKLIFLTVLLSGSQDPVESTLKKKCGCSVIFLGSFNLN